MSQKPTEEDLAVDLDSVLEIVQALRDSTFKANHCTLGLVQSLKDAEEFKRRVIEAFEPVKDWYDADGEREDVPAMIADAVADLQSDRKSVLDAEDRLRRIAEMTKKQQLPITAEIHAIATRKDGA